MKTSTRTSVHRPMRLAATVAMGALFAVGVASAAPSDSAGASSFHAVIPVRVLDTRNGVGAPLAPMNEGQTLDFIIPGLPDDATAVNVNLTVLNGTDSGFLTAFAKGDAKPWTSAVNWSSPAAEANSIVISMHSDHTVSLFNSNGTVDVIVDLVGFYAPSPAGGAPGAAGAPGAPGAPGAAGAPGLQGDPGPAGLDAPQVSPSPANYLYAVHTGSQSVATGGAVAFGNPPELVVGGLILDADQSSIIVNVAGPYKVSFSVSSMATSEVDLQVMHLGVPTTSRFASPAGQDQGSAILQLEANDVLRLVNPTGAPLATDDDVPGLGSAGIDSWIIVEQLNTVGAPI